MMINPPLLTFSTARSFLVYHREDFFHSLSFNLHRLSRWFSLTNQMTGCAWARPVFPCRKFHMDIDLPAYWAEVLRQDAQVIETFLAPNAVVNWHCTNEHFTAAEFIRANCEYPGH